MARMASCLFDHVHQHPPHRSHSTGFACSPSTRMVQVVTTLDDLVGPFDGPAIGGEKTARAVPLREIHAEVRMVGIGTLEGPGEPVMFCCGLVLDQAENAGARGYSRRSSLPVVKALCLRSHCFTDVVQERELANLAIGPNLPGTNRRPVLIDLLLASPCDGGAQYVDLQSMVTTTEGQPLAPSGTVPVRFSVCTRPPRSVARTVMVWLPDVAFQG